ncbi:hypothetical protein D3C77_790990 [compost metagenome]
MLCADVGMTQLTSFVHRELNDLLGTWCVRDICRLLLTAPDQRLYFVLNLLKP